MTIGAIVRAGTSPGLVSSDIAEPVAAEFGIIIPTYSSSGLVKLC